VVDPVTPPQATVLWSGRDVFVVRLRWRPVSGPADQADQERYQVLWLRDDKIREMAEYRTIGEATRTAKRFVARGAA
jgi:hypothetical protein